MATSGSTDFAPSRDQIIKSALQKCGVLGLGDYANSVEDIADANIALNMLAKSWQADGLQLWLQEEGILFLDGTSQQYSLGPASGDDHATTIADYVKTEMRVAGIATDTILEVDSTTGMTAADQIGIELDDGTVQWTTINTVTDSDTLVVDVALTGAAAIDNHVYTYTTKINRPLRITEMWHRDSSNIDTPIQLISRNEYVDLSDKASTGRITEAFYDKQLVSGKLNLWPIDDTVKDTIRFYYQRPIEDFDAAANTPDFPTYWINALVWGLSAQIAPEHGVDNATWRMFMQMAAIEKANAMAYDVEDTSVFFGVA